MLVYLLACMAWHTYTELELTSTRAITFFLVNISEKWKPEKQLTSLLNTAVLDFPLLFSVVRLILESKYLVPLKSG